MYIYVVCSDMVSVSNITLLYLMLDELKNNPDGSKLHMLTNYLSVD